MIVDVKQALHEVIKGFSLEFNVVFFRLSYTTRIRFGDHR